MNQFNVFLHTQYIMSHILFDSLLPEYGYDTFDQTTAIRCLANNWQWFAFVCLA